MDVPDILLVIQWRATCKLAALWQRFGRAVRDRQLTGTAILFAEKDHFDDERATKAARKAKRAETRKRTAKEASLPGVSHPSKRAALSSPGGDAPYSGSDTQCGRSTTTDVDLNDVSDEESDDEVMPSVPADAPGTTKGDLERSSQSAYVGKRWKRDLDTGIDFLINAEKRPGVMCQRKIFDVCFDNAAAVSDHHECNSDNAQGCPRCHVMEPVVCCNIHNPPEFASYDAPNPKAPRAAQRSCLPKYTKDKSNLDLENALLDWREEKTATVYGWACLFDNGPVVMTDSTLDRIVDCAHHRKIQTPQDLKRETTWADSDLYAGEVLSLIERHAALRKSLYISTPLRQSSASASASVSASTLPTLPAKHRATKCSACGQEGHNTRNRLCLKHPSNASPGNKENVSRSLRIARSH
ncbi:hypothetical protein EDD16DRAFT_1480984 [Pisolithus croceorrhizus]|nr:hypothetical protein EDD16DRAFT_1480984 [Pisolithus croceorrhizus]